MHTSDLPDPAEGRQSSQGTPAAPSRGKPRRSRALRALLLAFTILIVVVAGLAARLYTSSRTVRELVPAHILSTALNTLRGRPLDDWTPDKQFAGRDALNVLILGCDYDYDDHGRVIKGSARSDSILVARFDFADRRISALTIPRDTAVYIPGYTGYHKINAAHAYGGPQLSEATIQSEFGIPCDAYVEINFHSFQLLVDAIGGIDVNVKKKLDYDDNWGHLHIHLKPGYQHLNGYQAMGYVRMRHSDSDWMRSERQHEFLQAVRTKLASPSVFLRLPGLIDTLHDGIQHDITDDQMLALANFARSLPSESVEVATLPSSEGPSYVTVDAEKSAELIQRMFFPNQMVALNIDAPDPGDGPSYRRSDVATARVHTHRRRGHVHRRRARSVGNGAGDQEPSPDSIQVDPAPAGPGGPEAGGDSAGSDGNP